MISWPLLYSQRIDGWKQSNIKLNDNGFWELHTVIWLADLFASLLWFVKNVDIGAIKTQSQQGINDVF